MHMPIHMGKYVSAHTYTIHTQEEEGGGGEGEAEGDGKAKRNCETICLSSSFSQT